MMTDIETGLLGSGVPYIRGGSGPREAVLFFGANAFFDLNPAVEPVEIAWDARVYWASQLLRTSPNG